VTKVGAFISVSSDIATLFAISLRLSAGGCCTL
jgi:hypothetical protein